LTNVLLETHKTYIGKQFKINVKRGFLGMFCEFLFYALQVEELLDWMAFKQFQNKDGKKSIILEKNVDKSLWMWHAFFGLP
jgi:hypothetical protein